MQIKIKNVIIAVCLVTPIAFIFSGCSYYQVPSKGVAMKSFSAEDKLTYIPVPGKEAPNSGVVDIQIQDRRPTATFPASIVYVRVQEPGYKSYTNAGFGSGNYSVITLMDIEEEGDFEKLAKLHDIDQITRVNKLLLPKSFNNDKELREVAARLNSDMLLIYTVDTMFFNVNQSAALTVISLGLFPTNDVHIVSTVSAVLMDTRTGYIYGTIEETAKENITSGALTTKEAVDKLRLKIERQAFVKFLEEFEQLWAKIVKAYKK
jgi:hypothetical protein